MTEYIMLEEKDMDGVYCYVKKGELIRCKDCKAYREGKCLKNNMIAIYETDYCSRAERKEE